MAVFDRLDVAEVNKAIPMMVAWTVRFLICGSGGSGTLENHYSERAKDVSSGAVKTASQLYDAMKAVLPSDQTFEEQFAIATVSKNQIAKFYLRVLEKQNSAGEGELIVNPDPEKVNLEHVLPQTWTQAAWGHITQDQHRVLLKVKKPGQILAEINTRRPIERAGACAARDARPHDRTSILSTKGDEYKIGRFLTAGRRRTSPPSTDHSID